ncbi:hypothetical protein EVAR_22740_1 [Eumeta japonica]|uniref:Uncharacterized protein n=1 Tax=Eumeta variegata TaxID=151549 RepID=A0A4C1USE0_EUMVA|nr:hypothetical protein EVAR_22740_1 [Eumeta japonica]
MHRPASCTEKRRQSHQIADQRQAPPVTAPTATAPLALPLGRCCELGTTSAVRIEDSGFNFPNKGLYFFIRYRPAICRRRPLISRGSSPDAGVRQIPNINSSIVQRLFFSLRAPLVIRSEGRRGSSAAPPLPPRLARRTNEVFVVGSRFEDNRSRLNARVSNRTPGTATRYTFLAYHKTVKSYEGRVL